ncbi:MAG TPA: tail fiber domain-containing protein [Anaerolineae bacterium]|nr:tail fiber domain-containing protein [Anaerolineae bacterium]
MTIMPQPNEDDNNNNYGAIFAATGTGTTNYALYAIAENGADANYAARFDGTVIITSTNYLGFNTLTPQADIDIIQSGANDYASGGIDFTWDNKTWKIYNSGLNFSFAEDGIRRAYIADGSGAYVQLSDASAKKNVEPYADNILPRIMDLQPSTYHYIDQDDTTPTSLGFIAQEVETVFPEIVRTTEDGTKALAYDDFAILSIAAIQEQQTQIDDLQAENDELRAMIAAIHAQLDGQQVAYTNNDDDTHFAALTTHSANNSVNQAPPSSLLTNNINWLTQVKQHLLPIFLTLLLLLNLAWGRYRQSLTN